MNKKLYVGNLAYRTSEEALREQFGQFGKVVDVYLPMDRETGRMRGFGFVEMSTEDEASAAIRGLDGAMVDGRQIRVNEAQARTGDGGGGGGGGGGGRGGRGGGDRRGGDRGDRGDRGGYDRY